MCCGPYISLEWKKVKLNGNDLQITYDSGSNGIMSQATGVWYTEVNKGDVLEIDMSCYPSRTGGINPIFYMSEMILSL